MRVMGRQLEPGRMAAATDHRVAAAWRSWGARRSVLTARHGSRFMRLWLLGRTVRLTFTWLLAVPLPTASELPKGTKRRMQ